MKYKILLTVIVTLISACSNPVIGKKHQPHHKFNHEGSGSKFLRINLIDLKYDYEIDKAKNTISFDGIINCNSESNEDWYFSSVQLRLLFVDPESTIVAEENYSTINGERFCEPKPFDVSFDYKSNYAGIIWGYYIELSE